MTRSSGHNVKQTEVEEEILVRSNGVIGDVIEYIINKAKHVQVELGHVADFVLFCYSIESSKLIQ